MFCNFSTTTYGKWILNGEHAVLRNNDALVFPIKEKQLTLAYLPSTTDLSAEYSGSHGNEMHLLFWSVLEQGQHLLGQSLNRLTGHFFLESTIPIGVGLGASAALCVAMARWFAAQNLLNDSSVNSFARQLENLFHGQSSGLDIAGVSSETGLHFNQKKLTGLKQVWQPTWYLSSCGQVGITAHCINLVNQLWENDASKGKLIDQNMVDAVNKSRLALEKYTATSYNLLNEAINEGAACFKAWGLVSETLQHHMEILTQHGATAVKPTGSGGGGYVISLWKTPPTNLPFEVIKV